MAIGDELPFPMPIPPTAEYKQRYKIVPSKRKAAVHKAYFCCDHHPRLGKPGWLCVFCGVGMSHSSSNTTLLRHQLRKHFEPYKKLLGVTSLPTPGYMDNLSVHSGRKHDDKAVDRLAELICMMGVNPLHFTLPLMSINSSDWEDKYSNSRKAFQKSWISLPLKKGPI